MMIATLMTAAAGLFYLLLGIAAWVKPQTLLAGFGLPATTRDARSEIRAVYGGLPIAIAALVFWTFIGSADARGILLALAVISGGMAGGRVASAFIDRSIGRLPLLFLVIELALCAMLASGVPAP